MSPETVASLEDIYASALLIKQASSGVSIEVYLANWEKQSAIERQFIIIGESLARIRIKEPDVLTQIDRAKDIINFRNVLVHSYDSADPERIFELVHAPLDRLIEDVSVLLGRQSPQA